MDNYGFANLAFYVISLSLIYSIYAAFKYSPLCLLFGASRIVDDERGRYFSHPIAGIILLALSLVCAITSWIWTGSVIHYNGDTRLGTTICRYVQFQPADKSDTTKFYSLPTEIACIPGIFGNEYLLVRAYWPNGGYLDFLDYADEPVFFVETAKESTVQAQDETIYTAILTDIPAEHEKITVKGHKLTVMSVICAIPAIQFFLGAIRAFKRARQYD